MIFIIKVILIQNTRLCSLTSISTTICQRIIKWNYHFLHLPTETWRWPINNVPKVAHITNWWWAQWHRCYRTNYKDRKCVGNQKSSLRIEISTSLIANNCPLSIWASFEFFSYIKLRRRRKMELLRIATVAVGTQSNMAASLFWFTSQK